MITDIRAYSALDTQNLPRFVVRTDSNDVFVSATTNPILATSLNGDSAGVFLIPFRPNQSPEPWMYIAAREDYQKISVPAADESVLAYNAGIQEPQAPPDAVTLALGSNIISIGAGDWTNGGTAGAISGASRTTDTAGELLQDPVGIPDTTLWSVQVASTALYQVTQIITLGAITVPVQDVIPAINNGTTFTVEDVYYFTGSTGRCIVTPEQSIISSNAPVASGVITASNSIFTDPILAGLRRGALVELNNGDAEIVLVLSVTKGPNGKFCFECETTDTFAAGDSITGIPAIVLNQFDLDAGDAGDPITSPIIESALSGAGVGTLSQTLTTNPFTQLLDFPTQATPQLDDYINLAIKLENPGVLVTGRLIFNVGDTVDYTTDVYYVEFTAADLIRIEAPLPPLDPSLDSTAPASDEPFETLAQWLGRHSASSDPAAREFLIKKYNEFYGTGVQPSNPTTTPTDNTLYPSDLWAVLQFPIRTLIRAGQNQNRTLADCNGVQLQIQTTAATDLGLAHIWVMGGSQVDVGKFGSPYYYIMRGRSSLTGVVSNPSPASRYGVSPRRQRVTTGITDTVLDPQMDTWDVFRIGGTLTSYRYVGSMPNSMGGEDFFVDNIFDTALITAQGLDRDNFEPWPSVGRPLNSFGVTGEVHGTVVLVTFPDADSVPDDILRWLPGTLLILNGVAYTLWTRPTHTAGFEYMLQLLECADSGTLTTLQINEPFVARQRLTAVFGPDAAGTVFGCGDPLRPGTISYSKSYNPDSVPDSYNREVVQPSEPLIGGECVDGLASVASSSRWWDLYPQFGNTNIGADRYQPVERGIGRGLASPYGHCTDGKIIYFVANDGIWMKEGSTGKSLTDPDLRDLFPHEGVQGRDITYAGITLYAPDYTRTQSFRLSYTKSYLYFDYEDSTGTRRTLVCHLAQERPGWSADSYADEISVHYSIEGPENDTTSVDSIYPILVMGDLNNRVHVQRDLTNDDGVPINGAIATFEWNGGDVRADQFWGDGMVDALALSGITATPISNRVASGTATGILASDVRDQHVIHSAGIEEKYLGYLFQWLDDFDYYYDATEPTTLYAFQPLYQAVPLKVFTWKTQGTSWGFSGYFHVREVLAAYRSESTVTLTITVYDGTAPVVVNLPSTNGEERKILFPFSFNKALLYFFEGVSDQPWYPYFDAWEFHVGQWGRTTPYEIRTDVEAPKGIGRSIEN